MSTPDPFLAFSEIAHDERIEQAIVDLIAADSELAAWTGGRVFRISDPLLEPARQFPLIFVVAGTVVTPLSLTGENDVEVQAEVVAVYEEPRDALPNGLTGRNAKSLVHRLRKVLLNGTTDQYLAVPRFGNQLLVNRILEILNVDYAAATRPQPDFEPDARITPEDIVRYLSFGIRYEYNVDLTTWNKVGYVPSDYIESGWIEDGYYEGGL